MNNSSLNNPALSPLVVDENKMIEIPSLPYTLPDNGWVSIALRHNSNGYVGIRNLSTYVTIGDAATSGYMAYVIMFGRAGDVISIMGDNPGFIRGNFNKFK